jgi:hypothetical protein
MARASWGKLLHLPDLHLVIRRRQLPLVHAGRHARLLAHDERGLPQHIDTADERRPPLDVLRTSRV